MNIPYIKYNLPDMGKLLEGATIEWVPEQPTKQDTPDLIGEALVGLKVMHHRSVVEDDPSLTAKEEQMWVERLKPYGLTIAQYDRSGEYCVTRIGV